MTVRVGTYQTKVLQFDQASGSVQLTAASNQTGTYTFTFPSITSSRPFLALTANNQNGVLYTSSTGGLANTTTFTFTGGALSVDSVTLTAGAALGGAISGATTIGCSSTITSSAGGLAIAGPINGTTGVTALAFANFAGSAASSTDGAVWYDSTQKCHTYRSVGLNTQVGGCLFRSYSDGTGIVPASGAQNICTLGVSSVGTITVPANFMVPGRTIKIEVFGTYATASTSPTLTIVLALNQTLVAPGAKALVTNLAAGNFYCVAQVTARTMSSSCTLYGNVCCMLDNNVATMYMVGGNGTSAVCNSTIANILYLNFTCAGTVTRNTTFTSKIVVVTVIS